MSYERIKHQTRLTTLSTEIVGNRLQLEGYRDALRDLLDPVSKVEDINRETLVSLVMAFATAHINLAEKLAVIKKLQNILGY